MNETLRNNDNTEVKKKNVIVTNMDSDLWKKFKGTCAINGVSMNKALSELITSYITRD
jgi:hypothetical protein|tara:strand:+ start:3241 stop:3414 length:174 start_codon:yes stop_codon:yes gene_type:complete